MEKVYVVTAGCYSDYHISAIFSTQEKAEEYIAYHGTDYRMEEYPIDEEFEREESVWRVSIDLQDGLTSTVRHNRDCAEVNTCQIVSFWRQKINFYVRADTSERAIKIAREHFAAIKANEYLWQKMNTKKEGAPVLNEYPTYNFKEERFVDLD